uniref:YY1 associated factor 2 n=1 Tax=Gasterosteus aculeatus aculeatus TaxID=481459 RepID=A0AAQ4PTS7_GASAC
MGDKRSPTRPKRQPKPSDEGFWDCSVCTYKNTAEAFKCMMCDVRKGTSTRRASSSVNQWAEGSGRRCRFTAPHMLGREKWTFHIYRNNHVATLCLRSKPGDFFEHWGGGECVQNPPRRCVCQSRSRLVDVYPPEA